jgi:FixJ family two-component response regulator
LESERFVSVVDDDEASRSSVAALIESMDASPSTYSTAEAFLEAYDGSRCGCLVSDIRLRGISGIELLEVVSQWPFRPSTIIISAVVDVPLTVQAMRLGAFSVLQKPYRNEELSAAIAAALQATSRRRREEAHIRQRQARMQSLTPEEVQVLDRILEGKPNKGIAQQLDVGLRTVEARRRAIMGKLGAHSQVELVRIAWETRALSQRLADSTVAAALRPSTPRTS